MLGGKLRYFVVIDLAVTALEGALLDVIETIIVTLTCMLNIGLAYPLCILFLLPLDSCELMDVLRSLHM